MPAIRLAGKRRIVTLYCRVASLKRVRATAIRFSVPSSWACSSRKFWLAFRSGYCSATAIRRPRADPNLLLRLLELGQLLGRQVRCIQFERHGLGTGLDHLGKSGLLVRSIALDGIDQIGNQVGTTLVLRLDIGPSRIDGLFGRDHSVIGRTGAADEQHHKYDHYDPDNFFHFFYRFLVNFQIYQREPAPPPPKLPPPKPPPKPPPEPCPPPKPPIHIPPPPRWLLLSLRALRDCRFTTKPHLPQR